MQLFPKILSLLLLVSLTLITACATPETTPPPASPAETQPAQTQPTEEPSTPTPSPTAPETTTPTTTPEQEPEPEPETELALEIISITSPIDRGSEATLVAETAPGAECSITVYYKSGPSEAEGLESKTADANGRVSWSWKVGSRTTPDTYRIVTTASSEGNTVSRETQFTVVE